MWAARAVRALVLSRSAYREVAADPYMTGPAIAIALVASWLQSFVANQDPKEALIGTAVRLLGWLLAVLIVFGAGRLLGGRGSYTATLRAMGFAQAVLLLALLAFIPAVSSLARPSTAILGFVAHWMAGVEAQELRGWRGLLLPVARLVVVVLGIGVLGNLIVGAEFTIESLLSQVGLLAPGPQ